MKNITLFRVAIESILHNKMRSLLTMLGIIIGVGAVIVMVAVGQGAQSRIEEQVNSLGTNLIVITPGSSSQGGVSRGAGSYNRLRVEDAEKLEREGLYLSGISPVIMTFGQVVGGVGNWRVPVQGVSVEYALIRDWGTESGRFFDDTDVRTAKKVAIIGKTVAENLFPDMDPVGQQIRIRRVPFEIIGVLSEKGQMSNGSDQDDAVLVPYSTVQTRLAGRQFIAQILASTYSVQDISAAQEDIRAIMRESHELAEWEEDDFEIRNQTDLAEAATGTTEVMTFLLAAIASISLLVGGIGIMNIMIVSVTERTREIGVRMAVGAKGADVLTQFLVEAIVMSLLGGLIGLGLGVAGSWILGNTMGWATAVTYGTVFLAVGFSAAVGIFFGFYPARKAAALNPIEALRHE